MTESEKKSEFSYDVVPYISQVFPQTFPDSLAAIGKIYGVNSIAVEKCRVLELGCSDGTNLNAIAYTMPESDFIGIDLSAKQIADANQAAVEIGLKNVRFHQFDVLEMSAEKLGKFDFIIAHGLFSWVPDPVREKVLEIYREMLNPNGIGYLSYNVYPGCHLRDLTRNIMLFHVQNVTEPLSKVENSVQFIKFLTENYESNNIYQKVIEHELSELLKRTSDNIFHDDLEEVNQPFYFSEFVQKAENHGLQFLSEVEIFANLFQYLTPPVQEFLKQFGNDVVKIEQYLDFLNGRRFRQTLVCHREVKLNRNLSPEILSGFLLASSAHCLSETPEFTTTKPETFVGKHETSCQINHPLTKTVLLYLEQIWSNSIGIEELIEISVNILKRNGLELTNLPAEIARTNQLLFDLFSAGVIQLRVFQPASIDEVTETPKASDFARWQAKHGNSATNLNGLTFPLDDLMRQLVILANGTRTITEIVDELKKIRNNENLGEKVQNNLQMLAENVFLIG